MDEPLKKINNKKWWNITRKTPWIFGVTLELLAHEKSIWAHVMRILGTDFFGIFIPIIGEMNPIWQIYFKWVAQPPPRILNLSMSSVSLWHFVFFPSFWFGQVEVRFFVNYRPMEGQLHSSIHVLLIAWILGSIDDPRKVSWIFFVKCRY